MAGPSIEDYRAAAHPQRRIGGRRAGGEARTSATAPVVISVVTVVRNARDALARTLDSVLDQGWGALDYIVIDGASTDGTVDVIRAYEDRLALWISEPDGGIYDAMNKGIAHAEGDVVGLLNAGDRYAPGALRAVAAAFREQGAECIYYGDVLMRYVELGLELPTAADLDALRYTCTLPHPSVFIPRAVYARDGLYELRYTLASDCAYLAAQLFAGRRFHHIERTLSIFTDDGRSSTREGFFRSRRELVAFHRAARSGHAWKAALYAAFEIFLFLAHSLFRPLVGARVAGALQRAFFHWRLRWRTRR